MQTTNTVEQRSDNRDAIGRYLLLIALLLVVIGAGYFGFWAFAATIMPQMPLYNLWALALVAGIASFFSPCAFPLLPSYLSFYGRASETDEKVGQNGLAVGLGLSAAAGVVTFTLILGWAIGLLGAGFASAFSMTDPNPHPSVLWFRGIVGGLLIVLGFAQWFNVNLKPTWVDALAWRTRPQRESTRSGALTLYLYGFGYTAAGIGCTGPILAGLMVFAFSSGGFGSAMTAFSVFATTMGVLMLLVSGLVAASQDTLVQRLKASGDPIRRVAGVLLVLVGLFTLVTVVNQPWFVQRFFPTMPAEGQASMGSGLVSMDYTPPVLGLYEGEEIVFIHTEVSDSDVAALLTEMMGPQVIVMPQLSDTPAELLANVYVFTNGVDGSGPFGFQRDVFDAVPGDESYSPLRTVNLVAWNEGRNSRLLASIAEIETALANGEIAIEQPGIVVNMPILTWPDGER